MRSILPAAVIASALAITACSSSGGGTPTPAPSTSASTTSAVTTPSPAPSTSSAGSSSPSASTGTGTGTGTAPSHDVLSGLVVQASDLPTGFTSQPHDTTTDDDTNQQQIVACVGSTSVNPADKIEEVNSDDFVKDPLTISSDATSYTSQAAVDALVQVIQNPKAEDCFKTLLQQQVASSGGSVTAADIQVTPGTNGGPSNVVAVLQGKVDITVSGQQASVRVAEVFIEGRQLLATVSGEAINAPVDLDVLEKQVATALCTRVAAA